MKKNKLKLAELQVKSFVTEINSMANVKGGADLNSAICLTGIYPTLPVQGCVGDVTINCFTNNTTGTLTN